MRPPQHSAKLLNLRKSPGDMDCIEVREGGRLSRTASVLFLASKGSTTESLLRVLENSLAVQRVASLLEFEAALRDADSDLLLCSWSFPSGTWAEAVSVAKKLRPATPLIVVSPQDDAN